MTFQQGSKKNREAVLSDSFRSFLRDCYPSFSGNSSSYCCLPIIQLFKFDVDAYPSQNDVHLELHSFLHFGLQACREQNL